MEEAEQTFYWYDLETSDWTAGATVQRSLPVVAPTRI